MIGWQQSTTRYASFYGSGQSDSNDAICRIQINYFTTLVYKLDESECSLVPSLLYKLIAYLYYWFCMYHPSSQPTQCHSYSLEAIHRIYKWIECLIH